MTSYGRTDGIPNIMSPMIKFIKGQAKYYFMTSPDCFSQFAMAASTGMGASDTYSNGYDKAYASSPSSALAMYSLAGSAGGGSPFGTDSVTPIELVNDVKAGTYGVTANDVYNTARSQLTQLVRVGLFNERDANNNPIDYPYLDLSKGQGSVFDYQNASSKTAALQAAQESVVLLKNNNNVLPISKNSKVAVLGSFADTFVKNGYAVSTTSSMANRGESPLKAIQNEVAQTTWIVKPATRS